MRAPARTGNSRHDAPPVLKPFLRSGARVGAFPLADDSLDAALLVVLPPGIYTATGELVPDSGPGSILIEVYSVPEQ